jgi:acetyltransferase-like isoleucine patch superfamily enzyme
MNYWFKIRNLLRSLRCRFYHRLYGLKHVHKTVYVAKNCNVSKDLKADEYVYIGPYCILGPGVSIGAYSMLGPGVNFTGDDHLFDKVGVPVIFSGRPVLRKTIIGKDVWIGTNAIIMAGVTIGHGAIIAAGAVVNSNINECEIHGGIPNKKLRDRFQSEEDKKQHLKMLQKPVTKGHYCKKKIIK